MLCTFALAGLLAGPAMPGADDIIRFVIQIIQQLHILRQRSVMRC